MLGRELLMLHCHLIPVLLVEVTIIVRIPHLLGLHRMHLLGRVLKVLLLHIHLLIVLLLHTRVMHILRILHIMHLWSLVLHLWSLMLHLHRRVLSVRTWPAVPHGCSYRYTKLINLFRRFNSSTCLRRKSVAERQIIYGKACQMYWRQCQNYNSHSF